MAALPVGLRSVDIRELRRKPHALPVKISQRVGQRVWAGPPYRFKHPIVTPARIQANKPKTAIGSGPEDGVTRSQQPKRLRDVSGANARNI